MRKRGSLLAMFRNAALWLRMAVCIIALSAQLSAGARAAASQTPDEGVVALLCQHTGHSGPHRHIHLSDPALAANSALSAAMQLALLSGAPAVPPPRALACAYAPVPPARAPPVRFAACAWPTGPPA